MVLAGNLLETVDSERDPFFEYHNNLILNNRLWIFLY